MRAAEPTETQIRRYVTLSLRTFPMRISDTEQAP